MLSRNSSQNHSDPSNWANSSVQVAGQHDGTFLVNTLVGPLLSESGVNLAVCSPSPLTTDPSQLLELNMVYENRSNPPSTQTECEMDTTMEGDFHFGLSNGRNVVSGVFLQSNRTEEVSPGHLPGLLQAPKLMCSRRALIGDLGHKLVGPDTVSLPVSHDTFEPILPITQNVSPSSQTIRNYSLPSTIDRFDYSDHASRRPKKYSRTSIVARVCCIYQPCTKTFGRRLDMLRHYAQIHDVLSPKLDCKYSHCHRRGMNGFTRKDKLRDHQRAAHGSMG